MHKRKVNPPPPTPHVCWSKEIFKLVGVELIRELNTWPRVPSKDYLHSKVFFFLLSLLQRWLSSFRKSSFPTTFVQICILKTLSKWFPRLEFALPPHTYIPVNLLVGSVVRVMPFIPWLFMVTSERYRHFAHLIQITQQSVFHTR